MKKILLWIYSRYMNIQLRAKKIKVMSCANVKGSNFEGHNIVWPNVILRNCHVGLGTYIGKGSLFIDAEIGRFCSIAPGVKMISGRHPTRDFVSTHPSFFSATGQAGFTFVSKTIFEEYKFVDAERRIRVRVGNDVWIGSGAVILDGCTIGNGAIVAANCLVTHDVEPYSIVSGVPGRPVRYRFEENDRLFLQSFKWWHKDWEWIARNAHCFNNIKSFVGENQQEY